jgi:hypothetical protein
MTAPVTRACRRISTRPAALVLLALAFAGMPGRPAAGADSVDRAWLEEHYTKSDHMIPMRDGIRLRTAVYSPKDLATNYPIWITRTPYSIRPYGADAYPNPRGSIGYYGRDGFIFVAQDVRGRNGSEGSFVHVRPLLQRPAGPGGVDESTDTYDTIEWLLKHVPNNNGRVGLSGISYPGFYAACGAVDSHPALKAVSPQAPVSDWFLGDDWHHNGALYLPHAFGFLHNFEQHLEKPTRENARPFDYETPDGYEFFLNLGSLANVEQRYFKGGVAFWNDIVQHGSYDEFWNARNLNPRLLNVRASTLTVGGWFDAEDLYGALKVHEHLARQNPGPRHLLVMGPWAHGQWHGDDGDRLGRIRFRSRTAEFFRQQIELPFFNHLLKDAPDPHLPAAFVFETGTCQWRRYEAWPPPGTQPRTLYFHPGGRLEFAPPPESDPSHDDYVSDPAKPVPFIANIATGMTREHMLDDQRFAATRPDVLVYQTAPLEEDLTIAGPTRTGWSS